jgi:hypothetical protein
MTVCDKTCSRLYMEKKASLRARRTGRMPMAGSAAFRHDDDGKKSASGDWLSDA